MRMRWRACGTSARVATTGVKRPPVLLKCPEMRGGLGWQKGSCLAGSMAPRLRPSPLHAMPLILPLHLNPACCAPSGFRRSRRPLFGAHAVMLALQKLGQRNHFTLVRPNTGEAYLDMERRWVRVCEKHDFFGARSRWWQRDAPVPTCFAMRRSCHHLAACTSGPAICVARYPTQAPHPS